MSKQDHAMAAARATGKKPDEGLWETAKVIIQALLIAFFVRTFFFQPFNIPSSSMYPTLKVGDYLFVSKLSYGYGKYSFNFSFGWGEKPWVSCCSFVDFPGRKVLADAPQRGDVAVFKLPRDTSIDYIKRVIGLPGDRIQMREGLLHINDKPVKRERLSDFIGEDPCGSDATARVKRWKETLPNGVSYESLDCVDNGFYDNTNIYTVPPGHFFMMGDNRDNSTDSRVLSAVGYVPFENIVGRAQMIFFSIAEGEHAWMFWRWPTAVRWNRLFTIVR
jgi:signal peptidase I